MSEQNAAFEISVIEASLSMLNDNEKIHIVRKQNIKSRIGKIKQMPKAKKINFIAEYQDLRNKFSSFFSKDETPEILFRPHQSGIINPIKNYKTFPELQISPLLCNLKYADFEKTALALYADDITSSCIVNPNQVKNIPEIYQLIKNAKSIQKNKFYYIYDMDEFKQIRSKVFKNFKKIAPNFQAQCQSFYLQNKNMQEAEISLTPYQRYCLVNNPKYIFDASKPDVRHDVEMTDLQINQTLQLFRSEQNNFKENLISQLSKAQKRQ